jgi:drug/metabolite transporter (DMT)-like permease
MSFCCRLLCSPVRCCKLAPGRGLNEPGNSKVLLALLFALWFGTSTIHNKLTQEVLQQIKLPFALGICQNLVAVVVSFLVMQVGHRWGILRRIESEQSKNGETSLWQLGLAYGMGYLTVNVGYAMMNVPESESLRSIEPIMTILLANCLHVGNKHTLKRFPLCIVLPLIVAGSVCTFGGTTSYSVEGFFMAQGSNLMFSFRSVLFKKMRISDTPSTFYVVSKVALYLFLCFCFFFERDVLLQLTMGTMDARTIFLLLFSSLSYTASNLLSFFILNRLPIETHAIGNGLRRVFIIMYISLDTAQMSMLNAMGLSFAIISSVLYTRCMHFETDNITCVVHEQTLPSYQTKAETPPNNSLPPDWSQGILRSPKHSGDSSASSSDDEHTELRDVELGNSPVAAKMAAKHMPSAGGLPTLSDEIVSTEVGDFDVIEVR